MKEIRLPPILDEDKEFLKLTFNTPNFFDWIKNYAHAAVEMNTKALQAEFDESEEAKLKEKNYV